LIKNSQPFGKKFQKNIGGIFFDSHCTIGPRLRTSKCSVLAKNDMLGLWLIASCKLAQLYPDKCDVIMTSAAMNT